MDLSLTVEGFSSDDATWLGSSHGTASGRNATLDIAAFTEADHYPDGFFPSGIPLTRDEATGLYGPYEDSDVLAGFLLAPVPAPRGDSETVIGALLDHGRVKVANLPVEFTPPATPADNATTIIFQEVQSWS